MLRSIFVGPSGIRAGFRLALFIFIVVLLRWPLHWLRVGPRQFDPFDAISVLETKLVSFFTIVGGTFVMSKIENVSFSQYGLPPRRAASFDTLAGLLWGFASLSIVMTGLYLAGCYHVDGRALAGSDVARYGLLWAGAFVAVALLEEFSFRGYALTTLASGIEFWPAAVLTSAAFLLLHLSNPGENWMGLTDVFLIGIFFCLTLRQTGDLWFAVATHASWDWGLSYFYSVPDSGVAADGHLLDARLAGPAWLSGGTAGPEGSILTLVLHVAWFVVFLLVYPRFSNRCSRHPDRARTGS